MGLGATKYPIHIRAMAGARLNFFSLLIAVTLGLAAHALIGYHPFPLGDDFAYAPLADFRSDNSLFARDEQLKLFENHALVYELLYFFGKSGPGVEQVFRIGIWIIAITVAVSLFVILTRFKAPLAALPAVLALAVVVKIDGLGRGDYGGMIASFFHHHNIALALCMVATAAAVWRKSWLAGAALGLAAYAQPMTAFHGALAVGLGTFFMQPRNAFKMALVAIVIAFPAALVVLGGIFESSNVTTQVLADPINEAYRFRAPHHYDPPWSSVGLTTLYLLTGWTGAIILRKLDRQMALFSIGVLTALSLLHTVTLIVYKGGIGEWLPFFILDANRSSPLAFTLSTVFATAALSQAKTTVNIAAVSILLVAIVVL
ncbi:MAG: hypothetical protein AAGF53_18000, partial [Pseudomonadota bacterium]